MTFVHPLENPVWMALRTRHSSFAVMAEHAGRYPAEVAPFAAVDCAHPRMAEQLEPLVKRGESVYLLGVAPPLEGRWTVASPVLLPQMVCETSAPVRPGPEPTLLSDANRQDMLALAALVFPGFFRSRTLEMGRYIGIYHGPLLAAMAGERLCLEGYQEISGVCTHPEFLGRGYAQRLVALLTNASLQRNEVPFLHVHPDNVRAISVYERLGYVRRTAVPMWAVTRSS